MWQRSSVGWGVALSLALHGAWFGSLRSARAPRERPAAVVPAAFTAPFEAFSPPSKAALRAATELAPTLPGGPESISALDTDAAEGAGGSGASQERATLLFSFVSPLSLQDTELNNLAQSQTQRIQTGDTRATLEERRATPHAAEAVFLASGERGHQERRTPSRVDAPSGAKARAGQPTPARSGTSAGGNEPGAADATRARAAQVERDETKRGILGGAGSRASLAARVAYARPNVDRGPAATPAEALEAKVRDNHDAELLAAALQRSIVDASTQRARRIGAGEGGAESGPGLSQAGAGAGARARPYSPGPGEAAALDTQDARYVRWFLEQKQRVQNELTFPKPRALAKDQGISIFRVVVRRDGRLSQSPHLVRSSGFADFDAAADSAIRRALPFTPLPERLVPDAQDLTLLIPVAFSNPMVQ